MSLGDYDVEGARARIAGVVIATPLLPSTWLTDLSGCPIWLKLECLQVTGSFKLRGATNRVLSLDEDQRRRGIIATSSGNHGLATSYVAKREGLGATICVPEWVDPAKLSAIREFGAEAIVEGETAEAAEAISLRLARERGLTYVHPFDHPEVIAGHATIGREILEQQPGVDHVVVPMGGGGLIAGVAVGLKSVDPSIRITGVSAERAAVLARSVEAGKLVSLPEQETLATALAGNLGSENHHTLRLASELVDDYVEVSEEEIANAMRFAFRRHRLVVEGGGSVALAAILSGRLAPDTKVALVVSGGNIDAARFAAVVANEP